MTDFIEREQLFGLGCDLVELVLLASALVNLGAALWTLDKRLAVPSQRFGVEHQPRTH